MSEQPTPAELSDLLGDLIARCQADREATKILSAARRDFEALAWNRWARRVNRFGMASRMRPQVCGRSRTWGVPVCSTLVRGTTMATDQEAGTVRLEHPDQRIPLARASELSGLAHNTLRRAIFDKRLRAEKVARDWFTTRRWLDDYLQARGGGHPGRELTWKEGYQAPPRPAVRRQDEQEG